MYLRAFLKESIEDLFDSINGISEGICGRLPKSISGGIFEAVFKENFQKTRRKFFS